MPALALSPTERRAHRASAHHLAPVVMIGSDGLTPAVLQETDAALDAHGLIKLRVLGDDREARSAMLAELCDQLSAAAVQHIGKLLVIYRPPAPAEKEAPQPQRGPGPRTVKLVTFARSGNHRPQVRKVRVLGNERVTAGGSIKRARKRAASIKKKAP